MGERERKGSIGLPAREGTPLAKEHFWSRVRKEGETRKLLGDKEL